MKWDDEKVKEFARLYTSGTSGKTIEEKMENFKKEEKKAHRAKRKEWYSWQKRAESVGVAPLPPHRPSAQVRREWEEKIIQAEKREVQSRFDLKLSEFHRATQQYIVFLIQYSTHIEENYPDIHNETIKEIKNGNN
tara:strand:+ start:66 stop:473 length:408 start_codon:yes stop_codon:yes gene_type:complete